MSVKSAQCSTCGNHLPTAPPLYSFRLAPYRLFCGECNIYLKTSFVLRATWLSWMIWKASAIVISLGFIILVLTKDYPLIETIAVSAIGILLLGIGGGYIICIVLPLPIQIGFDLFRLILIKIGLVKEQQYYQDAEIKENIRITGA